MARHLRRHGYDVSRMRIGSLMRVMGLSAIYQKPNTSKPHPQQKIYPYLLRGVTIDRPNQVWCADISYIPNAAWLPLSGGKPCPGYVGPEIKLAA